MAVPCHAKCLTRRFRLSWRVLVFADRRRMIDSFCFKKFNIILCFHILCCLPIQHLPLFSHIMLLPNDAKINIILCFHILCCFPVLGYYKMQHHILFSHIMLLSNIIKYYIKLSFHIFMFYFHTIFVHFATHMLILCFSYAFALLGLALAPLKIIIMSMM